MGTRGLRVVRWRGRYHAYYSASNSFPVALGTALAQEIPSDPDAYQAWVQGMRTEYDAVETRLGRELFEISPAAMDQNEPLKFLNNDEFYEPPTYVAPSCDGMIEWVYIFDLDNELFTINNCVDYPLSDVPRHLQDHDPFDAWVASSPYEHPRLGQPSSNDTIKLHATTIHPKTQSGLNKKPAFLACQRLFHAFQGDYQQHLWQASHDTPAAAFLFREVAFILLALASCSPELITPDGYFASALFAGFHKTGCKPASSPNTTSYWLHGIFVSLRKHISCGEDLQHAVAETVQEGRLEGLDRFNAVVMTIIHVVLIRVTETEIQHTKRLRLVRPPCWTDTSGLDRVKRYSRQGRHDFTHEEVVLDQGNKANGTSEEVVATEENVAKPLRSSWDDTEGISGFSALAHVFQAAAIEKLRPSSSGAHGVFPNEIYRSIIEYVNPETRSACASVSRAFRDYATNVFCLAPSLTLRSYGAHAEPRCSLRSADDIGPFQLQKPAESPPNRYRIRTEPVFNEWYPVLGHDDGTASFMPDVVLAFDSIICSAAGDD
ncbi:hypothetical protein BDV95DRAFT_589833 [Massariosphaeria phaeospora]|uniref:Uncharacterized protein n=1 Tax=Massariosphaeria phaeospora TaxID=100035 RepID=A0A7C8MHU3_9PLEO|nr:hypothetical protein BDV95DRAFT_589833 [Massariosphaeria phaeospora]